MRSLGYWESPIGDWQVARDLGWQVMIGNWSMPVLARLFVKTPAFVAFVASFAKASFVPFFGVGFLLITAPPLGRTAKRETSLSFALTQALDSRFMEKNLDLSTMTLWKQLSMIQGGTQEYEQSSRRTRVQRRNSG